MGKIRRRAGAVGRRWGGEGESWGGLMAGFDGWMDWKGRKGKGREKGNRKRLRQRE